MISAGALRERCSILRRESGSDELGRPDGDWVAVQYVRCDVSDEGASEREWADGAAVVRTFTVRMRWNTARAAALTERDRLFVNGRTLRIESIRDMHERHQVAIVSCVEVEP